MSEDETGSGSISKNETRSGRSSRASTASSRPRSTPGRVATPSRASSSTRSGSFQDEERGELVGADEEHRIVEPERVERVDGPGVRVELDLDARERAERELGEVEPDVGRRPDVLVPGILDDADEQPLEVEVLDSPARELDVPDVRRVEGAAEDADAHGAHSSSSSPISTSAPLRTPADRSASSSSSPSGTSPTTR